jgi:hypothetical protein
MKSNASEIQLIASLVALPGKEGELREVLRGLHSNMRFTWEFDTPPVHHSNTP